MSFKDFENSRCKLRVQAITSSAPGAGHRRHSDEEKRVANIKPRELPCCCLILGFSKLRAKFKRRERITPSENRYYLPRPVKTPRSNIARENKTIGRAAGLKWRASATANRPTKRVTRPQRIHIFFPFLIDRSFNGRRT